MKILPANPADIPAISAAALADDHACIAPTHFLQNDAGEIRGFFSVGKITLLNIWSHTGNNKFSTVKFLKRAIELTQELDQPAVCPVVETSPACALLPDLGFRKEGMLRLFFLPGGGYE